MNTPLRLLACLLCVMSVSVAMPLTANAAGDEPAVSDDGPMQSRDEPDDRDVPPPNSGDEGASSDRANRDEPARASDDTPRQIETPSRPSQSSAASDRAAREAARRALFSDPKKEADKPNPLLDARGPDYYDRRAKELLAEDAQNGSVALHPLMQAHPDSYVVVCTGGCPSGNAAQIVSMVPRSAAAPAPVSKPETQDPAKVSCVAGCGAPGGMAITAAPSPNGVAVAATVGEWVTSVSKLPAGVDPAASSNGGSGDWMNTINRDRAAKAAEVAPASAKPAPAAAEKPAVEQKQQSAASMPEAAKPESVPTAKPAPVAAAQPPMQKPALPVVAENKPVAAAEAKPVEAKSVDAKPVEAKPVEAKPVQPKPAEMKAVEPKSSAVEAPEVKAPEVKAPEVKAGEAVKPADAVAKPAAPVATEKPGALAEKPSSPQPQQMAALETPKAPATTAPAKPAVVEKQPAPATSPAAAPAEKPAGASTSLFKDSNKVAAVSPADAAKPEAKPAAAPKERVISVLSEDREMNAAIEKSRGSLASFWMSFEAPAAGESDHALKVAIPGNGTTEHFWLTRIKRENGKLSGVISNQPQSVTSVKMGQRYEFTPEMISDWTFKRNGKLVGNETMRVLLPRMPEEQATVYRQMYETP